MKLNMFTMKYTEFLRLIWRIRLLVVAVAILPLTSIANDDAFEGIERRAKLFESALDQFRLGRLYDAGDGVEKNPTKALECYVKSAQGGNVYAQLELGSRQADSAKAFFWFSKAAEKGNAAGQFEVAMCYLKGIGVKKDSAKAVEYFRSAAVQGLREAQSKLAVCYEEGNGVEADPKMSKFWHTKAADHIFLSGTGLMGHALRGNANDLYNLGVAYESGRHVPMDLSEAAAWFERAAELGHADAQLALGIAYDFGKGVEKNPKKAGYWYQRAANQGESQAQFVLGVCFAEGSRGKSKDPVLAAQWFMKSAMQGHAEAQYNLGNRYARGDGVPRDDVEAYAFLNLAGLKVESARKNLSTLEETMLPAAKIMGQQRTKELRIEIERPAPSPKDIQRAIERERASKGA
jgi:uncharacterized protein